MKRLTSKQARVIYEKLLGDSEESENFEKISDRLIDLVIEIHDTLAEQINAFDDDEKILWILRQGYTEDEIEEYVKRYMTK